MDKELLIRKWLNDELTNAEMEIFKQMDDYPLHIAIMENAKNFKASNISTVEEFYRFKERYESRKNRSEKVFWL